jgi:aspartate/methionine/tyrosine aminotransferase
MAVLRMCGSNRRPATRAALWGLENLRHWLAEERAEILARRAAIEALFQGLPGWTLRGAGAYFAYVDHPVDSAGPTQSTEFAQALVDRAHVLALPGAMFTPAGDPAGAQSLRIAFANIDRAGIALLHERLSTL